MMEQEDIEQKEKPARKMDARKANVPGRTHKVRSRNLYGKNPDFQILAAKLLRVQLIFPENGPKGKRRRSAGMVRHSLLFRL